MIQTEQYTAGLMLIHLQHVYDQKDPHSSMMSIKWQNLRNTLIRGTLLHKKSKTNMIFYDIGFIDIERSKCRTEAYMASLNIPSTGHYA